MTTWFCGLQDQEMSDVSDPLKCDSDVTGSGVTLNNNIIPPAKTYIIHYVSCYLFINTENQVTNLSANCID